MISLVRQWLYEGRALKTVSLPATTVSVGNISLGGTGKSPFVLLLAEWALKNNLRTAVLTRGYKRKKTALEIVPPHAALPPVTQLGDEPWMIKHRVPGISLLVHADRARMAERHWRELGKPELVILDDAFQHWRAARDFDVVMVDALESLRQKTFPLGRLRESAAALSRADFIVITRARSLSPDALAGLELWLREMAADAGPHAWKRGQAKNLRIVAADYEFEHFFSLSGEACARPAEPNLLLVSGVAKPDGVRALAGSLDLPVKEEMYFPDHHRLSAGELGRIRASLRALGRAALVVTEKDWARWREELSGLPVYGMRVKFGFLNEGERLLGQFLAEVACSTSQ